MECDELTVTGVTSFCSSYCGSSSRGPSRIRWVWRVWRFCRVGGALRWRAGRAWRCAGAAPWRFCRAWRR